MEYVDNLCIPCPLHVQPKRRIHNFWLHNTIICLMTLVLEESILLVTLVHVLMTKVSKPVL